VVFDGAPAALTEAVARELYGMEANEAIGAGMSASSAVAVPEPANA